MARSNLPLGAAALLALLLLSAAAGERRAPAGPLSGLRTVASPTPAGSAGPHLAVSPEGAVWMS